MAYEKLIVWKRAKTLTVEIYKHLEKCRDFGFKDQITRSALSIPSNIAEGYERASPKEFANFLNYAKGSCGELRTQIYIGLEINYIEQTVATRWLKETAEISRMLASFIKTKKNK
ncbi:MULTISPECIES: four helix bundle protein [unclassified Vibrio]|uniref:Four helix bundle protein n=1 Tax=Vibrio sp. HB236076 TaxID=3232307 RepID=A0AB39HB26_9VIBR|nr:four helix bundle protein [Vibrio sp. HB161653]MDP5254331.1 four helix bundle protein [Vibrio sp. HB161653]